MYRAFKMMVDNQSVGMDIYRNNGSIWGIITNEKRWVFEFTKDGTLWYNYQFFMGILKFISTNDNNKNLNLITKWFEETYLNKTQVKHTLEISNHRMRDDVEDTIQNGVKYADGVQNDSQWFVENTIQNGVMHTQHHRNARVPIVEDTIQNGVKEVRNYYAHSDKLIEDAIENGVKETMQQKFNVDGLVDDTIKNGVVELKYNNTEQERKFNEIFGDWI